MTWRFHFPLRNYDFNINFPEQIQDKLKNLSDGFMRFFIIDPNI